MAFVYRVNVWESEKGWGSRIDERIDYPTPEEAKAFVTEFNNSRTSPPETKDWYMWAEGPYMIEVPDNE